jgi:hypothetical protein
MPVQSWFPIVSLSEPENISENVDTLAYQALKVSGSA